MWKNIYGAPVDVSGANARNMNENPEMGSLWKGRILIQVLAEKTEKPVLRIQDIPKEEVEKAAQYLVDREFSIMCQVTAAIGLPKEDTKYEVVVKVNEKEFRTGDPAMSKGCYNRYNWRNDPGDGIYKAPYLGVNDLGSVYVYLKAKTTFGEKFICFHRCSVKKFLDKDPKKISWVQLKPDLAIGEVEDYYKAGIVGIRIAVHDKTAEGDIDWKKTIFGARIPRRPGNLKVRAYIFQCRDLPAADSDGTSDPFLRITDSDTPQKTKTINDNLNPIFYEALDLIYEANNIEELPPIIIDCFDEDEALIGKGGADYLARCLITVDQMNYSQSDAVPTPKWHPLKFDDLSPPSGEILCSFSIVEDDFSFNADINNVNLHQIVEMREFQVSMNVLGMRALQSPGVLPVKKAFVKFNLKGLVPPTIGTNLHNLKTEPTAPGPNPTISTLMKFQVPLPIQPLYCPRLSCQVYDCIYTGFSQPIIGNFTIPIGELMHDLKRERDEETAALEKMVKALDNIAKGEAAGSFFHSKMQGMITEEIKKAGGNESDLKNLQASFKDKKKIMAEFAQKRKDKQSQDFSIGQSDDVDTQPLLSGDSNEELRQADRLHEKAENAKEGKMARVSGDQLIDEMNKAQEKKLVQDAVSTAAGVSPSRASQRRASAAKKNSGILTPSGNNKVDANLKKKLLADEAERVAKAKRDAADERNRELEEAKKTGTITGSNVVMPKYQRDEILDVDKEYGKPPESAFIGLGWDVDANTKRKHYRRFFPDELEELKGQMQMVSPFQTYIIKRGQSRGAKPSFWASLTGAVKQDASGQASTEQEMGKFKSVIEVEVKEEKEQYFAHKDELFDQMQDNLHKLAESRGIKNFHLDLDKLDTIEGREEIEISMEPMGIRHLHITKVLADIQSDVILQRMLLTQNKCIVRAYMISAFDLASRDIGGFSDPYIRIRVGEVEFNERDKYVLDEPNPWFGTHYDFQSVFPGCAPLEIWIMDYDDLFGDDLIGYTSIDLEDRYFQAEWRALKNKPVEFRQIYHPSSAVSQGVVKMWVEINPAKVAPEDVEPIWDITQKPKQEFELRLCVFDTKDIKMMDVEGTSDVFIRAFFDSNNALETDTHFRCQTGKASFNYRLLFREKCPRKDYRFNLQAYDRDFFKSNDIIGSSIIDLKQAFEDAQVTDRPLGINKKYYETYMQEAAGVEFEWKDDSTFWLPMNSKNDKGQIENNGYVRIQMDIVPVHYAEKNKVGSAREEPNANPFLPPPIGRLSFSLNPFKMFNQLVGPEMRRKIYCYGCLILCLVICVALTIYIIPSAIGAIVAKSFTG